MSRVPAGVTEVEFKRAFARLEQTSGRSNRVQRAESKSANTNIDAAALQLDMSRRFNLGGVGPRRGAKPGAPQGRSTPQQQTSRNSTALNTRVNNAEAKQHQQQEPSQPPLRDISCMSCFTVNLQVPRDSICYECGFFLEGPQRPAPPTMAQRRGLVEPAPQMEAPVLRTQWETIEERLVERKDANCPICMEGFNQGYEVLLSCSHIFHKRCIESFESFMNKGESRSCPICRKSNYQKKITKCGSAAWEIKCTICIQSAIRGYLARKYVFDSGQFAILGGKLRQRHLSREITVMSRARAKEVDQMVGALDATLDDNRELDLLFDQMLRNRQTYEDVAGAGSDGDGDAMEGAEGADLTGLGVRGGTRATAGRINTAESKVDEGRDDDGDDGFPPSPRGDKEDWEAILASARERGLGQCGICLGNNKGLRGLSLLSCSHIFHKACLESFKRFAKDRKVRSRIISLFLSFF